MLYHLFAQCMAAWSPHPYALSLICAVYGRLITAPLCSITYLRSVWPPDHRTLMVYHLFPQCMAAWSPWAQTNSANSGWMTSRNIRDLLSLAGSCWASKWRLWRAETTSRLPRQQVSCSRSSWCSPRNAEFISAFLRESHIVNLQCYNPPDFVWSLHEVSPPDLPLLIVRLWFSEEVWQALKQSATSMRVWKCGDYKSNLLRYVSWMWSTK